MTPMHVRRIDQLLEEHDRQEPNCAGTLYENDVAHRPEDVQVRMVCRCHACGLQWTWHEMIVDVLESGRRAREKPALSL